MASKNSNSTNVMKLYRDIPRKEVIEVIKRNATQKITTVVRGHNGYGKTAILNDLKLAYPNHTAVLCDMSTKEAGDMLMPKFQNIEGVDVCAGVPHKDLGLHTKGDVILFLDEIFKCKKALQVSLAQLLYDHKLGDLQLSKNSIILGASNLEDEGFGDQSLGFVYNRIAVIELRKPTGDDWADEYAIPNNLHPTIIQSAKEYAGMFADYRDYTKVGDNQYIFDPRAPLSFYTTGRSLERASKILFALTEPSKEYPTGMSSEVITHALKNIVGDRAAADIMSIHDLHSELPVWKDIIDHPEKATVPKSAGACCLLIYTAIQNLEAKTVSKWMIYLKRHKKEAQALFASTILRTSKSAVISSNKDFLDWGTENRYLYRPM